MIRVNFIVESFGNLKLTGGLVDANTTFEAIKKERGIEVGYNSIKFNFDIVHAHILLPFSLLYSKIARYKGIKTIVSAHFVPILGRGSFISPLEYKSIYRKLYNFFDYIIVDSEEHKKELEYELDIKKPIKKIELGINEEVYRFSPKKREKFRKFFGLKEDDFVVLNVAHIIPRKGIDDWLRIAKSLPNIKFIWVGNFPFSFPLSILVPKFSKMKSLIRNAPKNCIFTGFLGRENGLGVYDAYSGADLFLTPSYGESFGRTIIEAGAASLPIIARNLKVFEGLFSRNLLYANSKKEFIYKILWLKDNPKILKKYGRKARRMVVQKYKIEYEVKRLINFYKEIV